MLKVLWLCSWYPNKVSPFDGDFIQRHAQAASLHNEIYVIKLQPEPNGSGIFIERNNSEQFPHLTEIIAYYPKKDSILSKIKSYYTWQKLYKKLVKEYIQQHGKPHLVHVHIPFKSGLIALWIKRKFKIPYVVTEHWGGYNTIVKNNFNQRPAWFKKIIADAFKSATALHSVSYYLARQIKNQVCNIHATVIPNVVNTDFFYFKNSDFTRKKFRLLHISNGAAVKNINGIMAAFQKLNTDHFSLQIIGLPVDMNNLYAENNPGILFTGVISYKEIGLLMQNADVLLLFSNSENSPCVIGEAVCCGLPVIATNVGGISELIDEENGILVEPGNEALLAEAIVTMKDNYDMYNKILIAEKAKKKFSYDVIAMQFNNWYQDVLSSIKNQ